MVVGLRRPVKGVELHVALGSLHEASGWEGWLSPAESSRAAALTHAVQRARFVVSRGLRRKMLAELLGRDPAALRFSEIAGEKPRLQEGGDWDFNLSHAGDHVVVAAGQGAVGVDLERIRPVRRMEAVARRYFHPEEFAVWLSAAQRERSFFLLWSAREAAVKCTGAGLARGLAHTRIDPVFLEDGRAAGRVAGRSLVLRRAEAPEGYVLVTAQGAS